MTDTAKRNSTNHTAQVDLDVARFFWVFISAKYRADIDTYKNTFIYWNSNFVCQCLRWVSLLAGFRHHSQGLKWWFSKTPLIIWFFWLMMTNPPFTIPLEMGGDSYQTLFVFQGHSWHWGVPSATVYSWDPLPVDWLFNTPQVVQDFCGLLDINIVI